MAYSKLVKPGHEADLSKVDPSEDGGLTKEEALVRVEKLGQRMSDLQELLFAARRHGLLIVLQGRDTAGKDGSIRRLLSYVNVQSTRVVSFKQPTDEDLAHDFLWRVHRQTPGRGEIAIFNRSHYEDVLVVRVHELAPKKVWKARYEQINAFESLLVDSNIIVLKFYLHIDKDEQEERLLAREEDPEKAWKLSVGDWKERELWSDYSEAYEDALTKCSTEAAPWRIIPANHKWYRDLAIAEAVVDTLKPYEKEWKESLEELGQEQLEALREFRKR